MNYFCSYFMRVIATIILATVLLSHSSAQSPSTIDEQTDIHSVEAATETPQEASVTPDAPVNDGPLKDAYQALSEAEREFLDAAKADMEARLEAGEEVDIAEGEGASQAEILKDPAALTEIAKGWLDKIVEWMTSLPFLAQLGAIALSIFLAPIFASIVRKKVFLFRDPPQEGVKFKAVRDYIFRSGGFLRAVILVALLALFAIVLKAIPAFGEDWLVKLAQGVAVVFLLYKAIKEFITHDLFQRGAIWTVIPVALLAVFGFFDSFTEMLNGTTIMSLGDTPITLMTLIRLAIFGGLFFWLGNLSNDKGQTAIRSQESLDVATREVVAKLFQIILFIILFILILSFAGIPLSGLVVIFSAIGLGIGFGLQSLAANFVSGLIILFDRSVRKGDYVVLPEGQEGFVEAINMRSTTVETTDGKDIMVPNTTFIEGTYENWTHKDPRQRYEVHFMVAYDTDIDQLEDILIPEITAYDKVLMEPEEPDLELREFGEFGIKFAIEFWVSGIDDGPNKFTSDLNFIVWRALKKHGIQMPLPQREVRMLK